MVKMFFTKHKISVKQNQKNIYYIFHRRLKTSQCWILITQDPQKTKNFYHVTDWKYKDT